jgi:hypothetical protein
MPAQPGYGPPSGGFPQQPGAFPQQSGGFQQPYPGQPGQPVFGQQPGGYPGFPGGPGGPAKSKAKPWLFVGGGVVVLGVVAVLLFVFGVFGAGSKGSQQSPDQLAQAVADVLNNQDTAKANTISCTGTPSVTNSGDLQQLKDSKVKATVSGKAQVTGNTAKATIHLNFQESGHTIDMDGTVTMQQQGGKWCVPDNGFSADSNSIKMDGKSPGDIAGGGDPNSSGSGDTTDNGSSGLPGDGGDSTVPTS